MPTDARLLALGDFRFSVATAAYDELSRTAEYRWRRQDRIGRVPARQWLGPGDDTIELRGTILTAYRGGLGQVEAMKAEAVRGEPLRLVGGTGTVFGLWVVLRIRETGSVFLAGGAPRKVDFELSLAYYGEDGDSGAVFLAGDTATGSVASVSAIPQALPVELVLELPDELAGSLPVELPVELAGALPPDLPEGLTDGRGGAFGSVLNSLAGGRTPLPSEANRLRGQVRQLAGRLDLERQSKTWLEGLPGGADRAAGLALADSRIAALEGVLKPPRAVADYVGGGL